MTDSCIYIDPECLTDLRSQCEYANSVARNVRDQMDNYLSCVINALKGNGMEGLRYALELAKSKSETCKGAVQDAEWGLKSAHEILKSAEDDYNSASQSTCYEDSYAFQRAMEPYENAVKRASDDVQYAEELLHRKQAEYDQALEEERVATSNYERGKEIVTECESLRDKWCVSSVVPPWGGKERLKMLETKMARVSSKLDEIASVTNEYISVRFSDAETSCASFSSHNDVQSKHEDLETRKMISQEIKNEQVERTHREKLVKPSFVSQCPVCKRPLLGCICGRTKPKTERR